MHMRRNVFVVARKIRGNGARKISHGILLFAEPAKCCLSLSAPLSLDRFCRSRLPSSQKRRVPSAGYSPPDRRELPLCPQVCLPPASRFCPPSPANPHPRKFPPSARQWVSFRRQPADETPRRFVRADTLPRRSRARFSLLWPELSERFGHEPQSPLLPWQESRAECTSLDRFVPALRAAPSASAPKMSPSVSSCPAPHHRERFHARWNRFPL